MSLVSGLGFLGFGFKGWTPGFGFDGSPSLVNTYEIDTSTYEIDASTYEIDASTYEIDTSTYEIEIGINTRLYQSRMWLQG